METSESPRDHKLHLPLTSLAGSAVTAVLKLSKANNPGAEELNKYLPI